MRRINPIISKRFSSEKQIGPDVLVLITTGRKTGLPHRTPLQYEIVDGCYYVASARGTRADWFCNILKNPIVQYEIKGVVYLAEAEPISDPARIADFFEMRLERDARMVGILMYLEGLPRGYSREQLEAFSSQKALVVLHPLPGASDSSSITPQVYKTNR